MANKQINDLSTVATAAVTSSANFEIQDVGQPNPQSRQLNLLQIFGLSTIFRALHSGVTALSSASRIASGSASVTGTLAINTGLTTLTNVTIALRGAPTSSGLVATWSPLASAGWFSALVWANPVSTTTASAASVLATVVDWIAVGT